MGISLGIVGLGAFGGEFAPLFQAHPLVSRIALFDREPERIARFARDPAFQGKFKPADAYASMDEICRSNLDAVAIFTQPWLHAPQAVQVLESGKHVYSAVPIICLPDGDEVLSWCDRLVRTVRRTGLHYMLGETTYYRPEAMYCRRRSAEGAFGTFVHADGQYLHDVDSPSCNLRDVMRHRTAGASGKEYADLMAGYHARGVRSGPMHYPTHSVSGPICVMQARMTRVCAWGYRNRTGDPYFHGTGPESGGEVFSNETALFYMANGATCRIREYREIGYPGSETFRIYGTAGSYEDGAWVDKQSKTPLTVEQMRDPLPEEVQRAFEAARPGRGPYGGHGGSHAYLVHEFVQAIATGRRPAIHVWEAVRYMAPGVMAHKSALRDGEVLDVPDWGDPPQDQ